MKQSVVFILTMLICFSFANPVLASEFESDLSNSQVCHVVQGCTANLNVAEEYGRANVSVENSNSYEVTVVWTVYGYLRGDNVQREVAGGTLHVGSGDTESSDYFYNIEEYSSLNLKIKVWKCD